MKKPVHSSAYERDFGIDGAVTITVDGTLMVGSWHWKVESILSTDKIETDG